MLARVLVVAAVSWPMLAGAALWHRARHGDEASSWAKAVYVAAGQICHQRPERSFQTLGVKWPVCARCSGLYLAAPFGALFVFRRRRPRFATRLGSPLNVVVLAAVPTALTLLWEVGGLGTPSNLVRFAAAVPLGLAITIVIVRVTMPERLQINQVH